MVDRTRVPHADEVSKFSLPDLLKTVIANDIRLAVFKRDQQPVILLEIVIPIGRVDDPVPGLSYYTAKMLAEGTHSRSSNAIASAIDFYGGYLEVTPTLDYISIKLYAIKKFFKELFDILIDCLRNPAFPKQEFESLKKIRIEQIKQQLAKNSIVASFELRACLFGKDHPYGIQIGTTYAKNVDLDQVVGFYEDQLLRTPRVYLAGDVGEDEINQIEQGLASVPFSSFEASNFPETRSEPERTLDKKQSIQSSLRLGKLVVGRIHPDSFALKITNELIGGFFFRSRLMKNIREEKGLTYGIHSSIMHLHHHSYWQIGTDVLKEKREEAISEVLKEVIKIQQEYPDPDELLILKNYMKGKLLTSFDTIFNAIEMFKTTDLVGIEASYWHDLFDAIDRVTPEEITETAQQYFEVDSITKVVVG